MTRTFAYCRVSTQDQTTENQVQEISCSGHAIPKHRVVTETISGSTPALQRPAFAKLVDRLEPDDILLVTKLDRLGRNAMDVRTTVELLDQRGVRVRCLALGGVDLTSAAGKMTMGVIAAVAEFERDLLVERTQAGLKRARASGKTVGRPASLNERERIQVLNGRRDGQSLGQLAKRFGVSRAAIQRIEKSAVFVQGAWRLT